MTRLGRWNCVWSGLALGLILSAVVASRMVVDFESVEAARLMGEGAEFGVALPLTFAAFVLGAFVGVPQWVLIGGALVVFGPVLGAVVSWAATLASALVDFGAGRFLGGARIREKLGPRARRWMDRVETHGFWAALGVRLVPTGPFVLINLAAGASRMSWRDFAFGTAIGIVPKIAALALFGRGMVELLAGNAGLAAVLLGLGVLGVAALIWTQRRRGRMETAAPTTTPTAAPAIGKNTHARETDS